MINEHFMLYNDTAKWLYDTYAAPMPIIDYHCHLSPEMIAEDHTFRDACDLFLGGDHYKWRQMRSCGIPEAYITGDAAPYDKWCAFARIMPRLIGNPVYHWTALELKRYFDIDTPLSEESAEEIWNICNAHLREADFSARALILKSNVEVICTTDDPSSDLRCHRQIKEEGFPTKVLPTFRPDKLLGIRKPDFLPYLADVGIGTYRDMLTWLRERMDFFHANGCRLSDHSLETVAYREGNAEDVFARRMRGEEISQEDAEIYASSLMVFLGSEYAARGWTMQLHIGALRNNNSRMFASVGADAGFDSMNDLCVAEGVSHLLNAMDADDRLPKTILYCLNPKDNYVLGSMIGNFQSAPTPSKIQFGSGWWFNDNRDGMEMQLSALANLGALGYFVGMLTDSRSFVSYPRHEYFRRILCNLIGLWVERGEYPRDEKALQAIIEGICYRNAKAYFGF